MIIQSYNTPVSSIKNGEFCVVTEKGTVFRVTHDRTKLGAISSTILYNKDKGSFRVTPDKLVYKVLVL